MHSYGCQGKTRSGETQILVLSDPVLGKGCHKRKVCVFAPTQIPFPLFVLFL